MSSGALEDLLFSSSSSSSRKVQLQKTEDKRTALVAGCEDETKHSMKKEKKKDT